MELRNWDCDVNDNVRFVPLPKFEPKNPLWLFGSIGWITLGGRAAIGARAWCLCSALGGTEGLCTAALGVVRVVAKALVAKGSRVSSVTLEPRPRFGCAMRPPDGVGSGGRIANDGSGGRLRWSSPTTAVGAAVGRKSLAGSHAAGRLPGFFGCTADPFADTAAPARGRLAGVAGSARNGPALWASTDIDGPNGFGADFLAIAIAPVRSRSFKSSDRNPAAPAPARHRPRPPPPPSPRRRRTPCTGGSPD